MSKRCYVLKHGIFFQVWKQKYAGGGITDEDADKMIEVVEKLYIVMSNRK